MHNHLSCWDSLTGNKLEEEKEEDPNSQDAWHRNEISWFLNDHSAIMETKSFYKVPIF